MLPLEYNSIWKLTSRMRGDPDYKLVRQSHESYKGRARQAQLPKPGPTIQYQCHSTLNKNIHGLVQDLVHVH